MIAEAKKVPTIENRGSLMTYKDENGVDTCFGYLCSVDGRGAFEPTFGKMDVTPAEVEAHNGALSKAQIDGLDNGCEIGQGGSFYLSKLRDGGYVVRTWVGDLVSERIVKCISGVVVRFSRKGKVFEGMRDRDGDMLFCTRVE